MIRCFFMLSEAQDIAAIQLLINPKREYECYERRMAKE